MLLGSKSPLRGREEIGLPEQSKKAYQAYSPYIHGGEAELVLLRGTSASQVAPHAMQENVTPTITTKCRFTTTCHQKVFCYSFISVKIFPLSMYWFEDAIVEFQGL